MKGFSFPAGGRALLATALVFAALILTGLAYVAGRELREAVEDQAVEGVEAAARVFAESRLERDEFRNGQITPEALNDLRAGALASRTVLGARMWMRDRRVLLSVGDVASGSGSHAGELARAAFAGRTYSAVHTLRRGLISGGKPVRAGERVLVVSQPIVPPGAARPRYALELQFPYEPTAASIAARTRRLYPLVGLAALLLFAAVAPLLALLARRLATTDGRDPALENEVRRALAKGELVPFYQPKVDLDEGRIGGVEALVRWCHPQRGVLPPGAFLPAIERSEVMHELTLVMLARALEQAAEWLDAGRYIGVAVNVPPQSLFADGFPAEVAGELKRTGVPPGLLTLELTEGLVAAAPDLATERVAELRRLGVELALDDFGAGHSSLARLARLQLTEVKVDRAFVSAMLDSERDLTAVRLICDLGRTMQMKTTAEGVEREEEAARLRAIGYDCAQGYLYSQPLPAGELARWLDERVALGSAPSVGTPPPAVTPPRAPAPDGNEIERALAVALDAYVGIDHRGVITAWNREAERMLGWSAGEAIGRRLAPTIIPPRFWAAHERGLERFKREGTGQLIGHPLELSALHRSGREFPVRLVLFATGRGEEMCAHAFIRDVSTAKREARLRGAEHAAMAALGSGDATRALERVLEEVGTTLGFDVLQLWTCDDDPCMLSVSGAWVAEGVNADALLAASRALRLPIGKGFPGRALADSAPSMRWQVLRDKRFLRAEAAAEAGLHSGIALPLRQNGDPLGTLELFRRSRDAVEDDEEETLRMIAAVLCQVLARQRAERGHPGPASPPQATVR